MNVLDIARSFCKIVTQERLHCNLWHLMTHQMTHEPFVVHASKATEAKQQYTRVPKFGQLSWQHALVSSGGLSARGRVKLAPARAGRRDTRCGMDFLKTTVLFILLQFLFNLIILIGVVY